MIYTATGYDEQTVTVTAIVKVRDGMYPGFLYKYAEDRLLGNTTFEKQITVK